MQSRDKIAFAMFDARFDHAILIERDSFPTIERSDLEMKEGLGSTE